VATATTTFCSPYNMLPPCLRHQHVFYVIKRIAHSKAQTGQELRIDLDTCVLSDTSASGPLVINRIAQCRRIRRDYPRNSRI
jgi:hypothetical protein